MRRVIALLLPAMLAASAVACGDGEIGSGAAVAGGAAGDGPRQTETAAASSGDAADVPRRPAPLHDDQRAHRPGRSRG